VRNFRITRRDCSNGYEYCYVSRVIGSWCLQRSRCFLPVFLCCRVYHTYCHQSRVGCEDNIWRHHNRYIILSFICCNIPRLTNLLQVLWYYCHWYTWPRLCDFYPMLRLVPSFSVPLPSLCASTQTPNDYGAHVVSAL
jgi:hypothetical protein